MSVKKYWLDTDQLENYKELNSGIKNYSKEEIIYEFNDFGYRSDDFSLESELPILFMGCSFTEGCGLPINEVWSHHLHKTLMKESGIKMPFWSIAKGGTSIDYAARVFHSVATKLQPKYVFYLMSGASRREFKLNSDKYQNWYPNPSQFHKNTDDFINVSRLFVDDSFALYQTERSLIILNSLASQIGTKIFIFDICDMDHLSKIHKTELFSKFTNIEYFQYHNDKNIVNNVPDHIMSKPLKARDNHHPGALWQYKLYVNIWETVKSKILIDKKMSD
jgi:hypothetical protein